MGRNKFEDQIKGKLVHREITPSAGSWDKLSGQLNSEEKKKGFSFWWIGIAATILGAIFIGGLVYNSHPELRSPGIVETPVEKNSDINNVVEGSDAPDVEEAIVVETKKPAPISSPKGNQKINKKESAGSGPVAANNVKSSEDQFSRNKPIQPEIINTGTEAIVETAPLENTPDISLKMKEVMAEIAALEKTNGKVGVDEVDALLARAASQISKNRQEKFTSGQIDASALLWDVEMEMENSFREKIFELMKEGFNKARTAVANRNN